MPNQIILKNSSVVGKIPQLADLEYGEIALNYADGKIYYKTNTNQIGTIGTSTGGGGGGSAVSAGDTPPASPQDNDLWWNTETGVLNIYYNDGTSSQWVSVGGEPGADGLGVPAGGTTGQALIKNSSLDNDTRWGTVVEVTDAVTAGQFDRTATTPSSTQRLNYNGNLHATNVIAGSFTGTVAASNITATGTKDATTFLRGDNSWVLPPGIVAIKETAYFSGTGNFTPDPKTVFAFIVVTGGGGGGGSISGKTSAAGAAGGGGGGGTAIAWVNIGQMTGPRAYAVGAGGGAGTAGGNSSLGLNTVNLVGNGGAAGSGDTNTVSIAVVAGGAGGTGTGGDINIKGGDGGAGIQFVGSGSTTGLVSGSGGFSYYGGGGSSVIRNAAGTSAGTTPASTQYGAGGSGGAALNSATAATGGSGRSGYIWITEFLSS